MDKIFEISSKNVKVVNLSLEQFTELFAQEKENIVRFLKENFDNPERMTYFSYRIDHGTLSHPVWQTMYITKQPENYDKLDDERKSQFYRAYTSLKESKNWEKATGYRIYINEQSLNPKERQLSYSAFGEIEFLFDEETTRELKEADEKLAKDVTRFYNETRSNYRGD